MIDKKLTVILFLLIRLSCDCFGQSKFERIDGILKDTFFIEKPGAVFLVSDKDSIIFQKGYGLANLETDTPLGVDSKFIIASVTKQFTAIGILILLEEGKLNLSDEITSYIEDYPTHGHQITIHHLLTHTSGIKNYTRLDNLGEFATQDFTPIEFIRFFCKEPMDFAPGQSRKYSNSGYFILGYIIEKVSGMPYGDFIEERIFQPLGMLNSEYGSNSGIIKKRVDGYKMVNGKYNNVDKIDFRIPYSAGSLISTVEDLYKWNNALNSEKLISQETLNLAYQNYATEKGELTNYGYGFGLSKMNGHDTIEHSGGIDGYGSYVVYFPEKQIFIALLVNCSNCYPYLWEMTSKVAQIAFE